ncbi:NADH dehydrogenase I chain M [Salmonella enterica subsp. enterica]|nr:NADH dehydrogenase I chain M [Salmonella enterica subsp. enterica]
MLLPWLILIPFIGGFLCWQTERFGVKVPRWIALITMGADAGARSAIVVAGRLLTDAIRRYSTVAI